MAEGGEKRKGPRRRLSHSGAVYRSDGKFVCACVVLDLSDHGARLHVELPDNAQLDLSNFMLSLSQRGDVVRRCRAVWQRDEEMGVQFIERAPSSDAPLSGAPDAS